MIKGQTGHYRHRTGTASEVTTESGIEMRLLLLLLLVHCWSLADRQKAKYYVRDGVLYRNYKYLGQDYEQLVLPVNRRLEVMKLAHEIYAGHLGAKKTKERIKLSFTWPTIASDV